MASWVERIFKSTMSMIVSVIIFFLFLVVTIQYYGQARENEEFFQTVNSNDLGKAAIEKSADIYNSYLSSSGEQLNYTELYHVNQNILQREVSMLNIPADENRKAKSIVVLNYHGIGIVDESTKTLTVCPLMNSSRTCTR
jgi:hypothetical protein